MIDILINRFDRKLMIYLGLLTVVGTIMLYSASWYESFSNSNGIFDSTNNCSNGTSNSVSVDGATGRDYSISSGWIDSSNRSCDSSKLLLCIAKP